MPRNSGCIRLVYTLHRTSRVTPPQEQLMKVVVNPDLCEGHGKCEMAAPEVFELRDDDLSHVLIDDIPDEFKEKVDRAIRLCPRQAIAWTE